MTNRERIRQLEEENTRIRQANTGFQQEIAELRVLVSQFQQRIAELEARLTKDSHNSSKPPSSDGLKHHIVQTRPKSERKTGGQPQHPGHTLERMAVPDVVIHHRPSVCAQCQTDLTDILGEIVESRQVQDLPPIRLEAIEHQVEEIRCPTCQQATRGIFPVEVSAPVQYGPHLRALAVYLHQYQLLSDERTCQAMQDLTGACISEGTLDRWSTQAAERVVPQVERIAEYLRASAVLHVDETGIRMNGKLHWLHVASTRWFTLLMPHAKRGAAAMEAMNILPEYQGTAIHDRWSSYDRFPCFHQLCKAHLMRDLTWVAETYGHTWAVSMRSLLSAMHTARDEWTKRGYSRLPEAERTEFVERYFTLLQEGYSELSPVEPVPKRRGRLKQHPARLLLNALTMRAEHVIGFIDDGTLSFTNNQAERDLRPAKVQQKIAGTFRSLGGAETFCRLRSYLGTLYKQGQSLLLALHHCFFGRVIPVAWGT